VVSCFRTLSQHAKTKIDHQLALILGYQRLLGQLSYQRTLERGFALVLDSQGQVCDSQEHAASQHLLNVRFHDGVLPVSPLKIHEQEKSA